MKVIHVVESLHKGAVENWLVRMLREDARGARALDWTFYCALPVKGALDEEVVKLGARVVYAPVPLARTSAFIAALRRELRSGRYDVMHCHHDLVSAIYLVAAIGLPLRKFVHVHNADEALPTPSRLKQAVARPLMRRLCLALADRIIGISRHTLDTFLAGSPRRPGRDLVHYYGIDASAFEGVRCDRAAFRRELGLAPDTQLLLFAGRVVPEKNPLFALEVLAQMNRADRSVAGVFVGSGSCEEALLVRAHALGVEHAFRFLGWRSDIAEIMCCCDLYVHPRLERHDGGVMEGFGIAIVEAQLAGLRMLLSRAVADDPILPGAVFERLALAEGPAAWAAAGIGLLRRQPAAAGEMRSSLARSPMAMNNALRELQGLYA